MQNDNPQTTDIQIVREFLAKHSDDPYITSEAEAAFNRLINPALSAEETPKNPTPKWSPEDKALNIGIRMGLARAVKACKKCGLVGGEECEDIIRGLMIEQNERINKNGKI
jgi:hypothetical protein